MDYIKLDQPKTDYLYVLMVVDRFSCLVMFLPTGSTTAVFAARELIRWASQHGLPRWLITHGGSHFCNDLMSELTQVTGIEHHISLTYCP